MSSVLKAAHFTFLFVIALSLFFTSAIAGSKLKYTLTPGQIQLIASLERQNLLQIDVNANKAYLIESTWYAMPPNMKKDVAAVLSIYCANKQKLDYYSITIYGYQSGRKLAKYSLYGGFTTY